LVFSETVCRVGVLIAARAGMNQFSPCGVDFFAGCRKKNCMPRQAPPLFALRMNSDVTGLNEVQTAFAGAAKPIGKHS
jgi:hypothetical protein